jgi:hypothetical protein
MFGTIKLPHRLLRENEKRGEEQQKKKRRAL